MVRPTGGEKQVSQLLSTWLDFFPKLGVPPGVSHWSGEQTKAGHRHPLAPLPVTSPLAAAIAT